MDSWEWCAIPQSINPLTTTHPDKTKRRTFVCCCVLLLCVVVTATAHTHTTALPFNVRSSLSHLMLLDVPIPPPHNTAKQTQQLALVPQQSHPNAPPKPNPPRQFTANVIKSMPYMGGIQNVTMYYDESSLQSCEQSTQPKSKNFCEFDLTMVTNATTFAYVGNNVCRPLHGRFSSLWGFLVVAEYTGKTTIDNKECDTWVYRAPDKSANLTLLNQGDNPVRLIQQIFEGLPGAETEATTINYDFKTISIGKPDPAKIAFPEVCSEPPKVCDSTKGVQRMLFYLAHPPDSYNITDQDAADPVGDTAFTCGDVLSNNTKFDGYGVVSVYNVTVDTHWGQYALCNGYNPPMCVSQQNTHVGRESSFGCFHNGGQCDSDNPDEGFGFWFSFPGPGKCAKGTPVGQGCTWGDEQRIKTISFECLMKDRGMLNACLADAGIPYASAMRIFLRAFESDDAEQGGCPDVPPPSS